MQSVISLDRRIHIVGIGGYGMAAIARLLVEQGFVVSGCDTARSAAISELEQIGVEVYSSHHSDHVKAADAILATSAVASEHPELLAAVQAGKPVIRRHDVWAEWSSQRPVVAIAGSHGKTTTTAMLAHILVNNSLDCGYLIGGTVDGLGNSHWGAGPLLIEADEYARTFLALRPVLALITNVDWDHVDIYPTQSEYDKVFREFEDVTASAGGHVIVNEGDPGVRRVLPHNTGYGGPDSRWQCRNVVHGSDTTSFTVIHEGTPAAEVQLCVAGDHNVSNALAALAAASWLGVGVLDAAEALRTFEGAHRRLQLIGDESSIRVYDDYAHHPSEIRVTLQALRARFPDRRLVAYFQPHTFSRLQAFLPGFASALALADVVRVGNVFGAREAGNAEIVQSLLSQMEHPDTRWVGDIESATTDLIECVTEGDIVVTMNAGDGHRVASNIIARRRGTPPSGSPIVSSTL